MKARALSLLQGLFLTLVSSFLLVLSFPKFDIGYLAWISLLPLLLAICGQRPAAAFLFSLICGLFFFVGHFSWILPFPNFSFSQQAILFLYLGCYFGLFGLGFNFIASRRSFISAAWSAPFIWVSLEYIRSNLSFLALPWALLAHSQYRNPAFIQIASGAGTYGVSFLIVLVNCALAGIFLSLFIPGAPAGKRNGKILASGAALLVAGVWFYGSWTISQPITGKPVKISLVQGNIDQSRKWERKYADSIMQTYAELTQEAAREGPSLIVWPETATPAALNADRSLRREVEKIAQTAGIPLLIGSSQHQKFAADGGPQLRYANSAYLVPPDSTRTLNQRYDKIRLFPFGEFLPYQNTIPWARLGVPSITGYVPGKEYKIFELPGVHFGVTICWENAFPDLFRQFVKEGAQLMVNITNEAWFGKSAAPYQLVSISVFRAVENRVFVARCANTGISCTIDPYGRILDRVKDQNGKDIFVRGVLNARVVSLEASTLYTRVGDVLPWISLIFSGLFLFAAWRQ